MTKNLKPLGGLARTCVDDRRSKYHYTQEEGALRQLREQDREDLSRVWDTGGEFFAALRMTRSEESSTPRIVVILRKAP